MIRDKPVTEAVTVTPMSRCTVNRGQRTTTGTAVSKTSTPLFLELRRNYQQLNYQPCAHPRSRGAMNAGRR